MKQTRAVCFFVCKVGRAACASRLNGSTGPTSLPERHAKIGWPNVSRVTGFVLAVRVGVENRGCCWPRQGPQGRRRASSRPRTTRSTSQSTTTRRATALRCGVYHEPIFSCALIFEKTAEADRKSNPNDRLYIQTPATTPRRNHTFDSSPLHSKGINPNNHTIGTTPSFSVYEASTHP